MDKPDVTLPSLYLTQIIELLDERGIDTRAWLAASSFDADQLTNETLSLSWQALRSLLADTQRLLPHQPLGLLLGSRLLINTHGSLGYAAMSGGSARQVIDLLVRFLHLRTDLMSIQVAEHDDLLHLHFVENRPLQQLKPVLTETIMLAVRNILDFIMLGACPIQQVYFPFNGDAAVARRYFECPVTYQAGWAGFTLPVANIDKPLKLANKRGFESALRVCEEELHKLTANEDLSSRVRRTLLQSQTGFPSLDMAAQRFYMTKATFHRHLCKEGTSYRDILESVRQQLALRYLEEGHMTIKEIAYALGYAELSNFRKAFKRWYGKAPSQYLKQG
ncbi:AraC family transcriptional regulator [Aestuariibacter halophilus]|uniref:AraC family transcriptional regulator n=1 Tax=Fluctibacter halophilus TaxID=226011 RepID=A0ABS8GG90_9ALTE|nr:AraC family transcriptional regulator [Aestuariibacter halophilus]MCC2618196.1 AraC family transcriptional regulator [Aestuariibacter halophilus]